jgi:hypothetical protein
MSKQSKNASDISDLFEVAVKKQLGIIDRLQTLLLEELNQEGDIDYVLRVPRFNSLIVEAANVISILHLDYSEE